MDCTPDGKGFYFPQHFMYHLFDVDVAKDFGVDEAIMITNFQFWIQHNAVNKINFHEGRYWTFNSYPAFATVFPYYSVKQIRRIIASLLERNILISGNFNKYNFDKTAWYAFHDEAFWLGNMPPPAKSAQMGTPLSSNDTYQVRKKSNGPAQMGTPIPDTNTNTNTDETLSPNGERPQPNFIIVGSGNQPPAGGEKKKNCAQKEKKDPSEFWPAITKIWFDFYEDKKHEVPSFGKTNGKHLGDIMALLKNRAIKKNKLWDEQTAKDTLSHFLLHAFKDEWLSRNFLLKNILSNFDKIIADARGTNGSTNTKGQQPVDGISAFNKFSQLNNVTPGAK